MKAMIKAICVIALTAPSVNCECCDTLAVSSSSVAKSFQEHQLGIYNIKLDLSVNDRPVYKQSKGDQYLYYWVR